MVIELNGAGRKYQMGHGEFRALNNITLNIPEGQMVTILGPSGSGKSTMLNIMGSIDHAETGTVRVAGIDLSHASDRELTQFRCRLLPGYGGGTARRWRRHDPAQPSCIALLLQHEATVPRTGHSKRARRRAPESGGLCRLHDRFRAGDVRERISSQPGASRLQGRLYARHPAEVAPRNNHCLKGFFTIGDDAAHTAGIHPNHHPAAPSS
ncbi:MAG: ATP-binding cassette domain-containing protein [Candidatus Cryosericum sp.]